MFSSCISQEGVAPLRVTLPGFGTAFAPYIPRASHLVHVPSGFVESYLEFRCRMVIETWVCEAMKSAQRLEFLVAQIYVYSGITSNSSITSGSSYGAMKPGCDDIWLHIASISSVSTKAHCTRSVPPFMRSEHVATSYMGRCAPGRSRIVLESMLDSTRNAIRAGSSLLSYR